MRKQIQARPALIAAALCGACSVSVPAHAARNSGPEVPVCASPEDVRRVQEFYAKAPGSPLAIPGRTLRLPEVQIASGLARDSSIGIAATPEIVKKVWSTIDDWGKQTSVRLVFTMDGSHVIDITSLVPVRQKDFDDGWIDIYADDGKGVHGHLYLDRVKSIHAVDLPGRDEVRTRTVSFYGADGKLIIGVYASLTTKPFDQAAVDGFARTRALIASMPRVCP